MNGKAGMAEQKGARMNTGYTQVQKLLIEYGAPFDELLQLVKSGKLALYAMTRPFEYKVIENFDCYVDDWIAKKRERIERQYINNITHIHYHSERMARANAICQSIREHYQGQRIIRQIGVDEIIRQNHSKAMKDLADRERVARELAVWLYVKTGDYENMANSGKSPRQGKSKNTKSRIKETLEACRFVEMKYGAILLNKSKDDVFNLVKAEMNYRKPHEQTFNDWYTPCPFTRGAGNPHNRKKHA